MLVGMPRDGYGQTLCELTELGTILLTRNDAAEFHLLVGVPKEMAVAIYKRWAHRAPKEPTKSSADSSPSARRSV